MANREFSVQKKGLVFHSIAEHTEIDDTYEDVYKKAEAIIKEFGMTDEELEKYPILNAIPSFYFWWQKYVVDKVKNEGYTLNKECWENGTLNKAPLTGALDVCLINEQEKKFVILDYKSSSSAKLTPGYCNQLLLYVYMLAQKYQIPENKLTDRFRCYLFYPLAGIKNIDINDSAKVEKLALKNTLEYKFTLDDYHKLISDFSSIIDKTNETNWEDLDQIQSSNLSFSCSFCSFCGHPKYCKLSYDSGLFFPRSAKVMTKEEYKIWKENQKTN